MSYRATVTTKRAPVAGEFGAKMFARFFPTLDASKYADCWITWRKVERGGWCVTGPSCGDGRTQGFVALPGTMDWTLERGGAALFVSEHGRVSPTAPAVSPERVAGTLEGDAYIRSTEATARQLKAAATRRAKYEARRAAERTSSGPVDPMNPSIR